MKQDLFIYLTVEEGVEAIAQRIVQLQRESAPKSLHTNKEVEEPITIQEVCLLLRISRPTLHKWMAKGSLPFHRKGRRVYLFKSEVLKSLEEPQRLSANNKVNCNRGFARSLTSSQKQV